MSRRLIGSGLVKGNHRSRSESEGEMPLEPRASWFSPKCVEAQQLTRHLGVKHCFGAGRESGTKSRQTLNTRYDLKITRVKVGQ
ncbi:hypothetical protein JHK82_044038 [Glycine max]|nr:hypothetical protein JHK86_043946 [Glycine max]KAG5070524.1 hypothetical protein JHK85_002901 [Glycine max]KAG5107061.1 hypothetical protein JHK82_044031 [Glycine max]KAG5107068.1 hypothetical protein JHK82_044038 [Glycine max]